MKHQILVTSENENRFKWVVLLDETAPFPDDVLKIGHYLVPSVVVDSAMTVKIITLNGPLHHRSAYGSLTPDEIADNNWSDA